MAILTDFITGQQTTQDVNIRQIKAENKIDFSVKNATAGDVVQALKIPKNALVQDVFVIVRTPEGAICTATVGDSDSATGWDASTNLNASAGTVTSALEGTDAFGVGKLYTADSAILLTMGNNAATAVVTVVALYSVLEKV